MSMKITSKKSIISVVFVLVIILVVVVISNRSEKSKSFAESRSGADTISLFNGHDLSNWKIVLKDSLAPPDSTFFVKDGLIYCTGNPYGYIRTLKKYADYRLLVDWRWPEEAGNSGVFLFVNEDKVFPEALECQLFHGHAGDFIAMGGLDFSERTDKSKKNVPKYGDSSEKPTGQWNQYDIRVQGDSVSVYVNNTLQNVATDLNRTNGWIGLQSEGAPIEFRNIRLIKSGS